MQCHEASELLSTYMDGELPSQARLALEEHLRTCNLCSQELAALRLLAEHVRDFPIPEPDPVLTTRVMSRLPGRVRDGRAGDGRPADPLAWLTLLAAGSVATAVLSLAADARNFLTLWAMGWGLTRGLFRLAQGGAAPQQARPAFLVLLVVALLWLSISAIRRIATAPWSKEAL